MKYQLESGLILLFQMHRDEKGSLCNGPRCSEHKLTTYLICVMGGLLSVLFHFWVTLMSVMDSRHNMSGVRTELKKSLNFTNVSLFVSGACVGRMSHGSIKDDWNVKNSQEERMHHRSEGG